MANSYTVKAGDSWAKIAGEIYGNQRMYIELMKANGDIGMLKPGQTIYLPEGMSNNDIVITNKEAQAAGMATTDELKAMYASGYSGKDWSPGWQAPTMQSPVPQTPALPGGQPAPYWQLATQSPSGSTFTTSASVGGGTLTNSPTGGDRYRSNNGTTKPPAAAGAPSAPAPYWQMATQSPTSGKSAAGLGTAGAKGYSPGNQGQANQGAAYGPQGNNASMYTSGYNPVSPNTIPTSNVRSVNSVPLNQGGMTLDEANNAITGQLPAGATVAGASSRSQGLTEQQKVTTAQSVLAKIDNRESLNETDRAALTQLGFTPQEIDAMIGDTSGQPGLDPNLLGSGGYSSTASFNPATVPYNTYWGPSGFSAESAYNRDVQASMNSTQGGSYGPNANRANAYLGQGFSNSGITTGLVSWRGLG
jgi:hypothetical protein